MTNISRLPHLIINGYNGKYLNPHDTFGWNQQLINIIDNREVAYNSVQELIKNVLTNNPKEVQQLLIQFEANPTPQILAKIISKYIPTYGSGKDAKQALQSATRKFSKEFKQLMPGQYDNLAAYKWTYLDPEYLGIYKIDDSVTNFHAVILGRNH